MSIYDKISNAQETTWLTDGIAEAEAKSIIELAKISAKIERRRLELNMTQKEFAEFINCSKPTVERWERSEDVIRGPIVPFLKMLQKYPEYEQEVKVPEKIWPLRMWYMYGQDVCTLIDVNERERKVKIKN